MTYEEFQGLMDCKGYDLFPDGTLRPAHGLGEWVRAIDYDKLHAAAEAAQADAERYRWLREHDVLCWSRNGAGKAPIETSHGKKLDAAIDAAMKEAAVVFNKTPTGCEIKLTGGGGGGGGRREYIMKYSIKAPKERRNDTRIIKDNDHLA